AGDGEFLDLHVPGPQVNFFSLARQLVGRDASHLLCRKRRRYLLEMADKLRRSVADLLLWKAYMLFPSGSFAPSRLRIRGQTEADHGLIPLVGVIVELCQAGEASEHERQNARRHGVEGAEVSD